MLMQNKFRFELTFVVLLRLPAFPVFFTQFKAL